MNSRCSAGIMLGALVAAIRVERGVAAELEPIVRLHSAVEIVEHHFLVVAQDRHELTALSQRQQLVDDAAAIRPAIDAVAEDDERVVGSWLQFVQHGARALLSSRGYRR